MLGKDMLLGKTCCSVVGTGSFIFVRWCISMGCMLVGAKCFVMRLLVLVFCVLKL